MVEGTDSEKVCLNESRHLKMTSLLLKSSRRLVIRNGAVVISRKKRVEMKSSVKTIPKTAIA
jgi:hypothetical protein